MQYTRLFTTTLAASVPLAFAACDSPGVPRVLKADARPTAPVAKVVVVKPERGTVRKTSEQPGQVEAFETTPIHARLAGYVEEVNVDIGDEVKKGQVLASLRVPETMAEVLQKRAMVRQAEAEHRQSEAAVKVASAGVATARAKVQEIFSGIRTAEADVSRWKAEFARVDQLFRERALTGSLLDETRSKLQAAESGRDEVKAKVQSAEAGLIEATALLERAKSDVEAAASHIEVAKFDAERAEALAGYTKLVAPFDGLVTRRNVDTGQLTNPTAASDPLFVVARADTVTVSVGVPEAEAAFVNAGDPAKVRLQALEGKTFEGKVTRTSWSLNPATRTLRAEVDLPNPGHLLRPGLYAYVSILAEEHPKALTVPATAVVTDAGKTFCVTMVDKKAKRVEVKTGLTEGKRTEILLGLADSDEVVETGGASLIDGQAIEKIAPPLASSGDAAKPKR